MYLIEIDPITGLIKDDDVLDGWKAIPSFLALFEKEGYGIKAMTCVALVMDYTSIIKNYSEKERPIKAMEIVFDNRKALNWNCDEIQLACINYKELQYNPTLEEKSLLEELRISKLNEIKNVKTSFEKTTLLRELGSINDLVKSFEAKNGTANTFNESLFNFIVRVIYIGRVCHSILFVSHQQRAKCVRLVVIFQPFSFLHIIYQNFCFVSPSTSISGSFAVTAFFDLQPIRNRILTTRINFFIIYLIFNKTLGSGQFSK